MSLARFSKYMASWRAMVAGVVEPAGGISVARAHTSPGSNGAAADPPLPKVPRKEFAGDDRALKQAGRRLVEDASETLRPVNGGGGEVGHPDSASRDVEHAQQQRHSNSR